MRKQDLEELEELEELTGIRLNCIQRFGLRFMLSQEQEERMRLNLIVARLRSSLSNYQPRGYIGDVNEMVEG